MVEAAVLRIGELSRRSGVSPELLRAWERRYDLLQPTRSQGGLRLYSQLDLERVRAMQRHLAAGIAAAEAARLALNEDLSQQESAAPLRTLRADLVSALADFDGVRAQAALDSVFAALTLDTALSAVIIPYLHELGERWARGDATVAEEHFASGIIRGRLLAFTRDWGRGVGPRALLACAPGEQHDLGLIAFGLALRARGWSIGYLGADTPLESVAAAARALGPASVVISSVSSRLLELQADDLGRLAKEQPLRLGGKGAADANLDFEVQQLTGGPVDEAERLTGLARR